MANALLLLRLEHNQFDDLLKLVDQQLDQDGPVDLELLQLVVEYFAGYPDKCHHPVEDLVYRKMHAIDSARAAPVKGILQEHKSIAEATERFARSLEAAAESTNGRDTELNEVMRQFVDTYRNHMKAEEESFFALAAQLLGKSHWAEIEYDLFDQSDPLFDREEEDRFRILRREIDLLATASYRRTAVLREAKVLGQLDSVEAFNEFMKRCGSEYRLVEHPEGGYGLEYGGKIILDIPKCSPARAIWCAYFYAKGSAGTGMAGMPMRGGVNARERAGRL